MRCVHEEESVDIEGVRILDSDRVAVPHIVLCSNSHDGRLAIVKLKEATIESVLVVEEVDGSVGRIGVVPESPSIKERVSLMRMVEPPLAAVVRLGAGRGSCGGRRSGRRRICGILGAGSCTCGGDKAAVDANDGASGQNNS